MKLYAILAVLILGMIVGIYLQFFSQGAARERAVTALLNSITETVNGQDRAKIGAAFNDALTDDAKVHLAVQFATLAQPDAPAVIQDFDKASFLPFIDNLLFSLSAYQMQYQITEQLPNAVPDELIVRFNVQQSADGNAYYAGITVQSRFMLQGACEMLLRFEGKKPRIANLSCNQRVRNSPKSEEASKLRGNPEAMRALMR
ncbi:MAG: hypothetical protein SFT92_06340 [Rickettsiales bacterium]|nr:hypothetical protein [Rickettsiales bacterium]